MEKLMAPPSFSLLSTEILLPCPSIILLVMVGSRPAPLNVTSSPNICPPTRGKEGMLSAR